MKRLPPMRFPLFMLGMGAFLSVMAWAVTGNLFTLWTGGLLVGQGSLLVASALDKQAALDRRRAKP